MRVRLITILLLILFSCKTDRDKTAIGVSEQRDKWKEHFNKNRYEFNELRDYIQSNYINSRDYAQKLRIVLLNCRINQKILPIEICDNRAIDLMVELGIQEAAIEREINCKEVKGLNTIYFTMAEPENPVVIYIYEYCDTGTYYENSNIKYWPLDGHWALQFEN